MVWLLDVALEAEAHRGWSMSSEVRLVVSLVFLQAFLAMDLLPGRPLGGAYLQLHSLLLDPLHSVRVDHWLRAQLFPEPSQCALDLPQTA